MIQVSLRRNPRTPGRSKYVERCDECGARKYVWVSGNYPGQSPTGYSNFHASIDKWYKKHEHCGVR